MDLTVEGIMKLIKEQEQALDQFIEDVRKDIAWRQGSIAALKSLLPESEEDGGRKNE